MFRIALLLMAAQAPARDLSDAEVAHVAVTANSIDIELARLAQQRSFSQHVRSFANTMITDHGTVNEQALALARRLGATPQDNALSQALTEGGRQARRAVEDLRGRAFDRAYMDREINYHQAVLTAIDDVLVPSTENAELLRLLASVRPAIVAHLEHARRIKSLLGS